MFAYINCDMFIGAVICGYRGSSEEMVMRYTRDEACTRLMKSFQNSYNIEEIDHPDLPIVARLDFFEYSEKYVLSKKAKIWEADCEDFLYLFSLKELTEGVLEECRKYAWEDGLKKAHIGPGHMYSYITVVFVCESAQESAKEVLVKLKDSKSFLFSLHGWATLRAAIVGLEEDMIVSNRNGREAGKVLREVLYPQTKDKRRVRK